MTDVCDSMHACTYTRVSDILHNSIYVEISQYIYLVYMPLNRVAFAYFNYSPASEHVGAQRKYQAWNKSFGISHSHC